jgi:hypothetical protein
MATPLSDKTAEPWSKMDVVDLQSGLAFGTSMEEIADLMLRKFARRRLLLGGLTAQPH